MKQNTLNQVSDEEEKDKKKRLALIVLFLVLAVGLVFFLNNSREKTDTTGTVVLTEPELVKTVIDNHLSAYWVGPVANATYTLTVKPKDKGVVIRYIPFGDSINATNIRQIGTYSVKNAYSIISTNGTVTGNLGFNNVNGNSVFYSKAKSTNVYVGIKGKDIQVEVFDPTVDQALALTMLQGQVRPVSSN